MSNSYTTATACAQVPCTQDEYDKLDALLTAEPAPEADPDEDHAHGFESEHDEDGVYLFAEMYSMEEHLPKPFLKYLGELIAKAGMPFLEFGYANTGDRTRMASHSGGLFRIMPSGELVYPTLVWPS